MLLASVIDPFATKGVEYLLVITFLGALLLFWKALNPSAAGNAALAAGRAMGRWFRVPPGFHFHPGHAWARRDEDGTWRVGMDDFAQNLVGAPREIRLPRPGVRLAQGERGWSIGIDGKSVAMLSPLSGEVVEVNPELGSRPHVVNDDPYGRGWLLRIRPARAAAGVKQLLAGPLARAWMDLSENALRRRVSSSVGFALQDGGVPLPGMARAIDPETWDALAREYFLTGEDLEP